MKKVLLPLLVLLLFAGSAWAQLPPVYQTGYMTVLPTGSKGEDTITITAYPANACPSDPAYAITGSVMNLHAGLIRDTAWRTWRNVVPWNSTTQHTTFTPNPDGSFSIKIKPRDYFSVSFDTIPRNRLVGMRWVANGASNPTLSDSAAFLTSCRASLSQGDFFNCVDFLIPFPVPAYLATLGVAPDLNRPEPEIKGYPNPFVGSTFIDFSMPVSGKATVKVSNLLGQTIKTIADTRFEVGNNTLTWDGTDHNNKDVVPGIYFVGVSTVGKTAIQKMVKVQ